MYYNLIFCHFDSFSSTSIELEFRLAPIISDHETIEVVSQDNRPKTKRNKHRKKDRKSATSDDSRHIIGVPTNDIVRRGARVIEIIVLERLAGLFLFTAATEINISTDDAKDQRC